MFATPPKHTDGHDFEIAPPPKSVDGLLCVPLDISSIVASLTFDGAAAAASADAMIAYNVGPTAGNPIFDLRQTIDEAWLDPTHRSRRRSWRTTASEPGRSRTCG